MPGDGLVDDQFRSSFVDALQRAPWPDPQVGSPVDELFADEQQAPFRPCWWQQNADTRGLVGPGDGLAAIESKSKYNPIQKTADRWTWLSTALAVE